MVMRRQLSNSGSEAANPTGGTDDTRPRPAAPQHPTQLNPPNTNGGGDVAQTRPAQTLSPRPGTGNSDLPRGAATPLPSVAQPAQTPPHEPRKQAASRNPRPDTPAVPVRNDVATPQATSTSPSPVGPGDETASARAALIKIGIDEQSATTLSRAYPTETILQIVSQSAAPEVHNRAAWVRSRLNKLPQRQPESGDRRAASSSDGPSRNQTNPTPAMPTNPPPITNPATAMPSSPLQTMKPAATPPLAGTPAAASIPTISEMESRLAEIEAARSRRRAEEEALATQEEALRLHIAREQERTRREVEAQNRKAALVEQQRGLDERESKARHRLAQVEREWAALGAVNEVSAEELAACKLLQYIQLGIWYSTSMQPSGGPTSVNEPTSPPASHPQTTIIGEQDAPPPAIYQSPHPAAPVESDAGAVASYTQLPAATEAANPAPSTTSGNASAASATGGLSVYDSVAASTRANPSAAPALIDIYRPQYGTASPDADREEATHQRFDHTDADMAHTTAVTGLPSGSYPPTTTYSPSIDDELAAAYPTPNYAPPPPIAPNAAQITDLQRTIRRSVKAQALFAALFAATIIAGIFLAPIIFSGSPPNNLVERMDTPPTNTAQALLDQDPATTTPTTGQVSASQTTVVSFANSPLPVTKPAQEPTSTPPPPATATAQTGATTPLLPATPLAATPPESNTNSPTLAAALPTPSPALVADASGSIPTGAQVAATPSPPPQHDPATSVARISIQALGLDSAVVTVTPVAGSDGQMYWGVDTARLGLQTPGVGCGETGNIVVNGHNWVSHGVLMTLGKLHHDDKLASLNRTEVKCAAQNGTVYTYRVFAYGVFTPDDSSFEQLLQGEQRDLTIYTCTNSGQGRIVIIARLEI